MIRFTPDPAMGVAAAFRAAREVAASSRSNVEITGMDWDCLPQDMRMLTPDITALQLANRIVGCFMASIDPDVVTAGFRPALRDEDCTDLLASLERASFRDCDTLLAAALNQIGAAYSRPRLS